jgi:protocatechuate 3,4-dioxygenase beta subunit
VVDVWHCDAEGVYSGFDAGEGETFLRGAQVTNADGAVQFDTIYPGAYSGRTIHIHAKVHLDRGTLLTTQLFFDDRLNSEVAGTRDTTNADDGIFDEALVMTTRRRGDGYTSALTLDVRA